MAPDWLSVAQLRVWQVSGVWMRTQQTKHMALDPGCDFWCVLGEGSWAAILCAQGQAVGLPGWQQHLASGPASLVDCELVGSLGPCPGFLLWSRVMQWSHCER